MNERMATQQTREPRLDTSSLTTVTPRQRRSRRRIWLARFAQVAVDGLLLALAFWLAYLLRYRIEFGGDVPAGFIQPFSAFVGRTVLFAAVTLLILAVRGLYRLPRWTSFLDETSLIFSGVTTGMALVILYSFLSRFSPSRLIFLYAWILAILLLATQRLIGRWIRAWLWAHERGVDRVVVIGSGPAARRIMQYLHNHPQLGYRVLGYIDLEPPSEPLALGTERGVVQPPFLGTLEQAVDLIRTAQVDEVIVALPPAHHDRILEIIEQCREFAVAFSLVPDLFELALDRVQISEVAGLPLIGIKESRLQGWNWWIKRMMDIVLASLVLVLGAPLMLLIALAIKLDSPGPILFRQVRVGKGGKLFTLYKFRSMVDGADKQQEALREALGRSPLLFKLPNDPRVTRVGRVLRRTSLDELPQFFNVLKGEMSIVGPRPPVPEEVAEYQDWHLQRLLVTPGLTGLWQVNGRSDLTFDEMVRLDLYYVENWSPWLDLKVMLRTVPVVLMGRGAY